MSKKKVVGDIAGEAVGLGLGLRLGFHAVVAGYVTCDLDN